VNTAVPRGWKDENNSLIAQVAASYQNVKIVDWNKISEGHPEYFAPDGVHLVPTGIAVYVDAILAELE
jgi:lysophospholipase L1-like esterase